MLFDFAAVGLFILVSVAFIYGTLWIGRALRPSRYSPEKATTYECGEPTIGSAWVRYNIRFYTIALVYLIFDIEAIFLFPVARVLREFKAEGLGALALFEILFFVMVLVVGYVYAWRHGNLDWIGGRDEADSLRESAAADDAQTSAAS